MSKIEKENLIKELMFEIFVNYPGKNEQFKNISIRQWIEQKYDVVLDNLPKQ